MLTVASGAAFSPCRCYRWSLWRIWDRQRPRIAWIGLNPSTADETVNDPTVERCQRRSRQLGYGGFIMLNIFAFRSTDPAGLRQPRDPVGDRNDLALRRAVRRVDRVVCCWGVHGQLQQRSSQVLSMLRSEGILPYCLGTTRAGHPRHPLYLPYSQPLQPWT